MSQLQHIEQFLSFTLETKNLAVLEFIERPSYIREGGHHVGHWPTFLVCHCLALVTVHAYSVV